MYAYLNEALSDLGYLHSRTHTHSRKCFTPPQQLLLTGSKLLKVNGIVYTEIVNISSTIGTDHILECECPGNVFHEQVTATT